MDPMSTPVVELLVWVVLLPLAIGGLTAWRRRLANKRAKKPGLDARDRFEILNDILSAGAFFCPMALGFAYVAAETPLSGVQWWAALAGVMAIGCMPLLAHGRWYQKRRMAFEPDAARRDAS